MFFALIGEAVPGGGVTGNEGITSYEYKQLEQQNTRLRDTLVRLRDLSAHEKHEIQKIAKELETKKSEVNELQRTKKKLSAKVRTTRVSEGKQNDQKFGFRSMNWKHKLLT